MSPREREFELGAVPPHALGETGHQKAPRNRGCANLAPGLSPGLQEAQVKNLQVLGLPWWLSGKEAACQCRGCTSDPDLGRSHVLQDD